MAKQSKYVTECRQVLEGLASKNYAPFYVLHGDEPYFASMIANYLLDHAIPESMWDFNRFLLYGRDVEPGHLADMLRRRPFASDYLLVVVREAQAISAWDPILEYMQHPVDSTIFVLNFSEKIKPGRGKGTPLQRLLDLARSRGSLHEFAPLRDYEVPAWVEQHLKGGGYSITPDAAQFIVYQMGTDLSAIANQLEKLRLTLPPDTKEIARHHLSDSIGVSREFNPFELTRAIGQGDYYEANRIASHMAANPKDNSITFILSTVHGYIARVFLFGLLVASTSRTELAARLHVHPYFLSEYEQAARLYSTERCLRIFAFLRTMDLRTKGLDAEPISLEDALRETLIRIMR